MQDLINKLKAEMAALEYELRNELPKEILKARAHGDLSENAEYHAAKERQRFVDARLSQLQKRLRELSMVDVSRIPRDRVGLGSRVLVLDLKKEEEIRYKLVTSGKGLLGKKVGDSVKILIPGGTKEFEILEVVTIHDGTS